MRVFGEVPQEEAALFLEWAAKAFPHARLTVEGEAPQGPPAERGPSPRGVCGRRGETYWKSAPQIDWEVREGLYGLEGLEPSLRRALKRLAPSPKPLLLLGEVGSGKDYAARLLYQGGLRPGASLQAAAQRRQTLPTVNKIIPLRHIVVNRFWHNCVIACRLCGSRRTEMRRAAGVRFAVLPNLQKR